MDFDNDLLQSIAFSLQECSRQRVRSIQMGLREKSKDYRVANENTILMILEEHDVKIPLRTFQRLIFVAKDQRGINVEIFARYLKEAQKNTGRDSVTARGDVNDDMPQDSSLFWKSMFKSSTTKIIHAQNAFTKGRRRRHPVATPITEYSPTLTKFDDPPPPLALIRGI